MSRTKELKQLPENNVNIFELFSFFAPEKKSKYTEMLLRIMKKTPNIDEHVREIKARFENEFGISSTDLKDIPKMQLIFFYRIVETMFNFSDLKSYQKFCELNERGLIKQNDLSTYNSFDDITNSLSLAELIVNGKELEKQIKVVYEDDEWLLIRPLTYHASRKYGANTKWCTTQENNPEYFLKYANKGVLVYCINKKTGYKVASFYSLDKNDPEFSWWNQKDSRIDSLQSELTSELREIVYNESTQKNSKTNRFFLSDDERIKEEKILGVRQLLVEPTDIAEQPQEEERVGYLRRAIERVQDETVQEEPMEVQEPMVERVLERLWSEPDWTLNETVTQSPDN